MVLDGWADITSIEASSEGVRNVGVSKSTRKRIRIHDGAGDVLTSGHPCLVPIRVRVPNQVAIQPSVQQRTSDPTYPCWWQEKQMTNEVAVMHRFRSHKKKKKKK